MKTPSHHLVSLDAFRGVTVAGMILVNNPGNWNAVFDPLLHAEWNGCTLADLVFPWFLFILGVAMPFAFARRRERGDAGARLYWRIGRRSLVLIGLGLLLNAAGAWPTLSQLRIPGVLQRIGVVYFVAALIVLNSSPRRRVIVIAALLLGHWLVLSGPFFRMRNAAFLPGRTISAAIDRSIFGSHRLTANGDPEGLLGTLSATATALIGALVGEALRSRKPSMPRLAMGGVALTAIGLGWSLILPLNKTLWTGSYSLVSAGLATVGLAAFQGLMDGARHPAWAEPFVWLGINPLGIYFASELVRELLDRPLGNSSATTATPAWMIWNVMRHLTPGPLDDRWAALAYGVLIVALWTSVAGVLYKRELRFQV